MGKVLRYLCYTINPNMSTKLQITKNIELSEKLLDYLSHNPQSNIHKNVSYIIVTKEDEELNKLNLSMVDSLIKEGKKVVKALETNDKSFPWKFASL